MASPPPPPSPTLDPSSPSRRPGTGGGVEMKGGPGPSAGGGLTATPRQRPPLLGPTRASGGGPSTGRLLTWLSLVAGLYVAFR